jgi:hypothetical protein
VYDVLTQASQQPSEQLAKPRDKIYLSTSKWRSIQLRITEALKSLSHNINLEEYPSQYENEAKNIHSSKGPSNEMINDFEKLFNKWSDQIASALDGTEKEVKKDDKSDPRQELDYWKQKMR